MRHRALTLFPTIVLLTACVSAPERLQPEIHVTIPESYGTPANPGALETEWWNRFQDDHLPSLIGLALESNYNLHAAVARLDRATAEARIAGADLKPNLGVSVSGGRQRQNFVGFPFGTGDEVPSSTFDRAGLSLDASWEIDLWGRIRASARSAVAEWQATEADLRAVRLSIAAQTAKTWFAVLEAGQQATLARESVESFRRTAEQVRARYAMGIRGALDLRLALSNLAAAEALLELRRIQYDRATRQLEVLLGRYPDGSILEAHPPGDLPGSLDPVPAGLPAELLARRPDLVAAERRLAAADQRYLSARRALYPRLTLTASGGTVSEALADLLNGDFRVWSLLGGLTQPLFQGGKLRAGVKRADAVSDEALALYVGRALEAFAEVESELAAGGRLAKQELHLAEAARQLRAARGLAEERYRTGVGFYLVVLESQTRALTAESALLALRRERLNNRINLHLALGGGFESGPSS
jgi:NodT family efflux transporter outer membrane factor (OMF) lipoprotein